MVSKDDHASDTGSLVIFVLVLTISCFPSPKKYMNHNNEAQVAVVKQRVVLMEEQSDMMVFFYINRK